MSFKRRKGGAYSTKAPKGPNGENLCRWCRKQVKPPKRTFCGKECIHEWKLRTSSSYMRACMKKRDKEICANCNLDCKKLRIELNVMFVQDREKWKAEIEMLSIPKGRIHKSLWDADHIIPVIEGGGECGLENMRTLCIWCHRHETNQLLARRAQEKKNHKLSGSQ